MLPCLGRAGVYSVAEPGGVGSGALCLGEQVQVSKGTSFLASAGRGVCGQRAFLLRSFIWRPSIYL